MKNTKKVLALLLALVMVFSLAACGEKTNEDKPEDKPAVEDNKDGEEGEDTEEPSGELKEVDKLTVQFVPSKDPEEIMDAAAPLAELLQESLKGQGYDVKDVELSVGTTYEAVGEGLSAGSIDVGLIPAGTYITYKDGAEVLLAVTREGYNKTSAEPKDWNDGTATETDPENQVDFYRSMILAGPSEVGQKLAEKVNNGEELTWDDLNEAKWATAGPTSSSGYIYPYLWLNERFEKGISDLDSVLTDQDYTTSLAKLASEDIDIMVGFADARIDQQEAWTEDWGRENSIWEETNIIGLGGKIMNDTVSYSKNSETMDEDFAEAVKNAFLEIIEKDEGKAALKIYNVHGYKEVTEADYEEEEKALEMIKNLNLK